jgi:hypothetical protein
VFSYDLVRNQPNKRIQPKVTPVTRKARQSRRRRIHIQVKCFSVQQELPRS